MTSTQIRRFPPSSHSGLAMIVVVGILGVLVVLTTAFMTLSQLERKASQRRIQESKAYLLARSGLEDALARLEMGQAPDALLNRYGGEDADLSWTLDAGEQEQETYRSGELNREDCPVSQALRPSWFAGSGGLPEGAPVDGRLRGYTGRLETGSYAVKALGGGFHVNGGDPAVASDPSATSDCNTDLQRMLGVLAEAIDREDGVDDALPVDQVDGERLVARRPVEGWQNFEQVREALWPGDLLAQTRLNALRPYLALHAWVDRKVIRPNAKEQMAGEYQTWSDIMTGRNNIRMNPAAVPTRSPPDFERIGTEVVGRAPVDLGWARTRRPALIALLAGLKGLYLDETAAQSPKGTNAIGTLRTVELGLDWSPTDDCHAVADQILAYGGALSTWDEFNTCCDALAIGDASIQVSDVPPDSEHGRPAAETRAARLETGRQAKRDLLKANFNPNSDLNKFNPDRSMAKLVDKSDLLVHTTEFILGGMRGETRVSSQGRVVDAAGRLMAQRVLTATLPGDRVVRLTTQREFVCEDLGDVGVAGDEKDYRKYGESADTTGRPFISESRGIGRTYGHLLDTAGYLGGSSGGASLQTGPEASPVWTNLQGWSPSSSRTALDAAAAALATAQAATVAAQAARDAALAAYRVDPTPVKLRALVTATQAIMSAQAAQTAAQVAYDAALIQSDWISAGPAPASYDGQVRLATVETGTGEFSGGGRMMFLGRWCESLASDDVGNGPQPNETPADVRQPQDFCAAWHPRTPGNLRPDGIYSEAGCQPAYLATGNMHPHRGSISFWVKPNYDLSQYRDEFIDFHGQSDRLRIYMNNTRTGPHPTTASFFLLNAITTQAPKYSPKGFGILWEDSLLFTFGGNEDYQTEQQCYTPMRPVTAHRWHLLTYQYDAEQPEGALGTRILVDRGQEEGDRNKADLYWDDIGAPDADWSVQAGGRAVFALGLRGAVLGDAIGRLASPDTTFDEFAIYDLGSETVTAIAITENLADNRFEAGRFYKESAYAGPADSSNRAGEYFSPLLSLGSTRLKRIAWTQVVPRALKPLSDPEGAAAAAEADAAAALQRAREELAAALEEQRTAQSAFDQEGTQDNLNRLVQAHDRAHLARQAFGAALYRFDALKIGPEDADAGPEGCIVMELSDLAGRAYCQDASGRAVARTFTDSAGERIDRTVSRPFRLHAIFQPNLSDPLGTAILDPLVLDDITLCCASPLPYLSFEGGE